MNSPSNDLVRVLIVDGHGVVREGLTSQLNDDPNIEVVATAATPDEALVYLEALDADVAVIDAHLPDDAAFRLCRQIRELYSTTQCVLHTASSTDHDGAAAVVVKQLSGNELANTIHRLANNHHHREP